MKEKIRLLRADEIECRAASVSEKGVSLLLYKDARVDQKILDETFGIFGWKRSHQCIDGNLYCTVEVYDKDSGIWVSKQDVGTTGYAEKEKSQASDSFKRACFNWGIGRELYTAPFIWIPAEKVCIREKNGRMCCSGRFSVDSIRCNEDREITSLVIINECRQVVFSMNPQAAGAEDAKMQRLSAEQMDSLDAELKRTGVGMEEVRDRYKFSRPEEMSGELYDKVMRALARTKSAKVDCGKQPEIRQPHNQTVKSL